REILYGSAFADVGQVAELIDLRARHGVLLRNADAVADVDVVPVDSEDQIIYRRQDDTGADVGGLLRPQGFRSIELRHRARYRVGTDLHLLCRTGDERGAQRLHIRLARCWRMEARADGAA